MADVPFITPVYSGPRFDDQALPVEVLPDLAAYREIVLEVAKSLYFQRNPGRKRLPNGFEKNFKLRLKRIDAGSSKAVMERVLPTEPQLDYADEFVGARDLVSEAIAAAAALQAPPAGFPPHVFPLFQKFGRDLREGESIQLQDPATGTGPIYTLATRRRIVQVHEILCQEEVSKVGRIAHFDAIRQRFLFQPDDGSEVWAPVEADHKSLVLWGVSLYPDVTVSLEGTGEIDRDAHLVQIVEVKELAPTFEPLLDARLAEIQLLAGDPGWLDDEGEGVPTETIDLLRDYLPRLILDFNVRPPFLYPTPNGTVQAEWSYSPWELKAEFNPDENSIFLSAINIDNHTLIPTSIACQPDNLRDLALWIQEYSANRGGGDGV